MCPRKGLYSHLILVLAFFITQIQNTLGISIAKRVTMTNTLKDFQVENTEKTFENLPTTHLLEDIQPKIVVRNTRKAPLKKGKKSGKNYPFSINTCNDDHVLDYGEATVIFSDDGNNAQRCRSTLISPRGTTIRLDCPMFRLADDGCKKEKLLVNEKEKKKIEFCKTGTPDRYESSNNNMALVYRRKAWKKGEIKSPGFICKAMVIGERSTTSTTPTTSTTTTMSTITPTNSLGSTTDAWWPPGTNWSDQQPGDPDSNTGGWWTLIPTTSNDATQETQETQETTSSSTTQLPFFPWVTAG